MSQHTGEGAEGGAADGWPGLPVAHEMMLADIGEAKLVLPEVTLGDEIALPEVGARHQEIDARPCHGAVGRR